MKQTTALNILKTGANVFLTGSAGAGKTYTLNQYIHYLKARKVPVAITASTGIAATHMNGMTIHTWAGIGIKDQLDSTDLARMFERKYLRTHLDKVQVLIIDEISMLHAKQLELVNQVLQYFKGNQLPFGGIQVVVSGDFFQLPPVGKPDESNRDKFAFMSKAWVEAKFSVCYLTEQYRQDDQELNQILNEIRSESISSQSIEWLQQSRNNLLDDDITKLYTHNADVEQINQRFLNGLDKDGQMYTAELKGNEKMLMTLAGSVRAPEKLVLKLGAKVMFVKNNFENGYINGTLGEVVGFVSDAEHANLPKVRLRDGSHVIAAPEVWSVDNDGGKPLATFSQVPLCLAWAMTVHKSQGMTLEAAEIDLSNTFEKGQGYVALSRLKSLSGLRLLGFNRTALELDRLAIKADQRFAELSHEAESNNLALDPLELGKQYTQFIRLCGGTLDPVEIGKYEKKLQKSKGQAKVMGTSSAKQKDSTTSQTRVLFEQGMSILQISQERELSQGTIIGHLAKIKQHDPSFDVSRIRPTDDLLAVVKPVYEQLMKTKIDEHFSEDGSIKLRPIFEAIGQKYGYNDIKLALIFIE